MSTVKVNIDDKLGKAHVNVSYEDFDDLVFSISALTQILIYKGIHQGLGTSSEEVIEKTIETAKELICRDILEQMTIDAYKEFCETTISDEEADIYSFMVELYADWLTTVPMPEEQLIQLCREEHLDLRIAADKDTVDFLLIEKVNGEIIANLKTIETSGESELGNDIIQQAVLQVTSILVVLGDFAFEDEQDNYFRKLDTDDVLRKVFEVCSEQKLKSGTSVHLRNPRWSIDPSMTAGQKVTWDCIWFGSYPQREVIADESSYDAVFRGEDDSALGYYNKESDVIEDAELFSELENATGWDKNGDITIGDSKYRRMKKEDATFSGEPDDAKPDAYKWNDSISYHYFKYEPIKWRVLDVNNDDAFLLADIALDDQQYNKKFADITWENSTIRSWLNGYGSSENTCDVDYTDSNFIDSAFSSFQRSAIKNAEVVNNDNIEYGTAGGNDTKDKVFLLSESEVYATIDAKSYGFLKDHSIHDEGRMSKSSTYVKAMGADSNTCSGNCLWWLRSLGNGTTYATSVSTYGSVNYNGYGIHNYWHAIRPALHLDISSPDLWSYAGTVCSDGTVNEVNSDKESE